MNIVSSTSPTLERPEGNRSPQYFSETKQLENMIRACIEEAKPVVEIFEGNRAFNKALLLYTLAREGPLSRAELNSNLNFDDRTVRRLLKILCAREYVDFSEIETLKPGTHKFIYYLTPLGLGACAFLDLDDETLETAPYIDVTGVVDRESRQHLYNVRTGKEKVQWITIGKKGRSRARNVEMAGDYDEYRLPVKLRIQEEYMQTRMSKTYRETKWGKQRDVGRASYEAERRTCPTKPKILGKTKRADAST